MVKLDVRAGSPPTALEMLTRFHRIGWLDEMDETWDRWEDWFVELEESHTSHPVLVFFRSQRPASSWITSAGAALDTMALALAAVDVPDQPQTDGDHPVRLHGAAGHRPLLRRRPSTPTRRPTPPSRSTARSSSCCATSWRPPACPCRPDREQAWRDFAGWRVNYDEAAARPVLAVRRAGDALVVGPVGPLPPAVAAPSPLAGRAARQPALVVSGGCGRSGRARVVGDVALGRGSSCWKRLRRRRRPPSGPRRSGRANTMKLYVCGLPAGGARAGVARRALPVGEGDGARPAGRRRRAAIPRPRRRGRPVTSQWIRLVSSVSSKSTRPTASSAVPRDAGPASAPAPARRSALAAGIGAPGSKPSATSWRVVGGYVDDVAATVDRVGATASRLGSRRARPLDPQPAASSEGDSQEQAAGRAAGRWASGAWPEG